MCFVVIEDLGNRLNTGVLCRRVNDDIRIRLVPIGNSTNKGRNEENASVGAGSCLLKTKQQCEVAMDATLF